MIFLDGVAKNKDLSANLQSIGRIQLWCSPAGYAKYWGRMSPIEEATTLHFLQCPMPNLWASILPKTISGDSEPEPKLYQVAESLEEPSPELHCSGPTGI